MVELLIAVCILAVAVIPMLRSFISSIYANSKSRERLNASMVAEDIVEGLKNHKSEEIERQFLEYTPSKWQEFTLMADGIVRSDTRISASMNGDILNVKMKNLHVQSRADVLYDATLSFNAASYKLPAAEENIAYNSRSLAKVKDMDSVHDAIFRTVYPTSWTTALDTIKRVHPEYEDVDFSSLSRLMIATVVKEEDAIDGGAGKKYDRISGQVEVRYYLKSFGDDPIFKETYPVYDNIDTAKEGGTLENFYFFYHPGYEHEQQAFSSYDPYKLTDGTGHHDTIIFNNPDDIPLTFFITKQERYDDANLGADEIKYRPYVIINEGGSTPDMVTDICSNLDLNLLNAESLNLVATNVFSYPSGKKVPEGFNPFKGIKGDPEDRFFDVKVAIYAADKKTTEIGDDFPAGRRLTRLSSTKID